MLWGKGHLNIMAESLAHEDQACADQKYCKNYARVADAPRDETFVKSLRWLLSHLQFDPVQEVLEVHVGRRALEVHWLCFLLVGCLLECFVGLDDGLVALLLIGIDVWVILQRELLESSSDLLPRSTRRQSKDLIRIETRQGKQYLNAQQ